MSKVTIYDIAKVANCSTATVSLALSGNERIRPETRQRIINIANELGYAPSYIAQSLAQKNTRTIGLIVPNIDNPVFAQMVSGVETVATSKGYNLILGLSHSKQDKELFYLDMLQRERVDGLIVLPTFLESFNDKLQALDSEKTNIVLCGSSGSLLRTDLSYAKCDNRKGALLAVEHLIKTGKKRIGCIFPVSSNEQYYSRKLGYQDALKQNGIDYEEELIKLCSPDNDSIYTATEELLKAKQPDAIFCLYDYCAISVMRAIYSLGLRIPEDISVIGYDNIPQSEHLPTSLSTIDTCSKEVGHKATEILLQKISNPHTPMQQITIQPSLIVRESTLR